jgi:hypothetical protein
MEISSVFENEYSQNIGSFDCIPNKGESNGRTVVILKEDKCPTLCKTINSRILMNLMMTRPDRADASVRGGVDEERGMYIEGSMSVSWGDSKPSSNTKSEKDKPSDQNESENK